MVQVHFILWGYPVSSAPFVVKTIPSSLTWYHCQESTDQTSVGLSLDSMLSTYFSLGQLV